MYRIFCLNAGGIISCVREYQGAADEQAVNNEVRRIGDRVGLLVQPVQDSGIAPARVALMGQGKNAPALVAN